MAETKHTDGKPREGDLRWCGMCSRAEIYVTGEWREVSVKRGTTITTPIPRMTSAEAPDA